MFAQPHLSLHFQHRRFTVLSISQDLKPTKPEKNPSWNPLLFPPAMHHVVHCDKCLPGHRVTTARVPSEPAAPVPAAPPRPLRTLRPKDSGSHLDPGKGLREHPSIPRSILRRLCRSCGMQVGARDCSGTIPTQGDAQDAALLPPLPQPRGICQSCAQCLSFLSLGKINAALVACIY